MLQLDNGYIAPALISEVDDDAIHQRMLENLPDDIDKTEGGFAHDFTRPAALEKAELLIAINDALQVSFPAWSYGAYLDLIAAHDGLTRKSATYAETYLSVTGVPGTIIPEGFLWSTPSTAISNSVEFVTVEDTTIDEDGDASVLVRCTESGIIGNVPANSITLMTSPMGGIATITNEDAASGGTETETDNELRARIEEKDKSGESSFVGCDADYKRWAKEVDGVGDVTVIPEWQGPGTGTVKLIVMDSNGEPATATLLTQVYNHIMATLNRDSRLAPIGAILTVVTATETYITVVASVELEEDAVLADVSASFETALKEYFSTAKYEGEIKYTRVGSILSETSGVADYDHTSLLLNSGTANITIDADDYPVVSTVTLTEVS